jgi:hypothetical protein
MLLLTTGCSSTPAVGSVKGKVTVNGKPLPRGLITFLSTGGNNDPFNCNIINGEYEIPELPVALAKVCIIPPTSETPPPIDQGDLMPVAVPTVVRSPFHIPEHYQNPETSGLEFTIKKGENEYNIDIKN